MIEILFWLTVGLGLITVVGHLIWIGIAALLRSAIGPSTPPPHENTLAILQSPDIHSDAKASFRLLQELRRSGEISDDQFRSITGAIQARLDEHEHQFGTAASPHSVPPPVTPAITPGDIDPSVFADNQETSSEIDRTTDPSKEIVFAEMVEAPPAAADSTPLPSKPKTPAVSSAKPAPPASMPAPPVQVAGTMELATPARQRGIGELLSAFMRERNIRWGELVSGILIIGSAVGLVISLRDQLQEHIPYFSPLLFLLITSAIHAAGIYTLRRWRLRDTSRGVLIIGMLLIPLNFFAACTLAEPRPLTDPVYWIALAIGLTTFSALTAFAAQALLRKHWWPLWVGVMGTGASQLWINRSVTPESSSLALMSLVAPAVLCFAVAVLFTRTRIWNGWHLSVQTCFRIILVAGIGVFSFGCVLALAALRSGSISLTAAGVSPWLSTAALLIAWLGWFVFQNVTGRRASLHSTLGAILAVMGVVGALAALVSTTSNATMLGITAGIDFGVLLALASRRSMHGVVPIAWLTGVIAAISVAGHVLGVYGWDEPTFWPQHREILTSVWTPYGLLLMGVLAAAVHGLSLKASSALWHRWGLLSGAAAIVLGCIVSIAISVIHPDDLLNMHSATLMLLLVLAGLSFASCRLNVPFLPHAMAGCLIVAMVHALYWNPVGRHLAMDWLGNAPLRWGIAAGGLALLPALILLIRQTALKVSNVSFMRDGLAAWSVAGSIVAVIAGVAAILIGERGFGFVFVAALSCWMIGEVVQRPWITWLFGIVGAMGVTLLSVECPLWFGAESIESAFNVWNIPLALAVWSVLWKTASVAGQHRRWQHWLLGPQPRPDLLADAAALVIALSVVSFMLVGGVFFELFGQPSVTPQSIDLSARQLVVLALVGGVIGWGLFDRPNYFSAVMLVVWWFATLASFADLVRDQAATLSALRWLLALGGILLAVVIAGRRFVRGWWVDRRRRLRLQGRCGLKQAQTQSLIGFSSGLFVVGVVISTAAPMAQAMLGYPLHGPLPESWMARLPIALVYAVPIVLVAGMMLIYSASERRESLAAHGTAVFLFFVALLVGLLPWSWKSNFVSDWFTTVLQSISIAMSAYGAAWWWIVRQKTQAAADNRGKRLFDVHLMCNVILAFALPLYAILNLLIEPRLFSPIASDVGAPAGYASLLAVAALVGLVWQRRLGVQGWSLGIIGCGLVGTIASTLQARVSNDSIVGVEFLLFGTTIVSVMVAANAWRTSRDRRHHHWIAALPLVLPIGIATAAALRVFNISPTWGPIVCLLVIAISVFTLAIRWASAFVAAGGTAFAILAILLVHDAESLRWYDLSEVMFWQAAIVPVLLLGCIWNIAFSVKRRVDPSLQFDRPIEFTQSVALVGIVTAALSGAWTAALQWNDSAIPWQIGSMALIGLFGVFLITSLWVERFTQVASLVYIWAAASILAVHRLDEAVDLTALKLVGLGTLVAIVGILWFRRASFDQLARRWKIPARSAKAEYARQSIPVISMAITALIALPCLMLVSSGQSLWMVCLAVILGTVGMYLLAREPHRPFEKYWTLGALAFAVLVTSLSIGRVAGSALENPVAWAARIQIAASLLAVMMIVGQIRIGVSNEWHLALRHTGLSMVASAVSLMLVLVGLQLPGFDPNEGSGPQAWFAITAAGLSIGVVTVLIAIAIRRDWDPLVMAERYRQAYVYVAQALLLLICLHVYLAAPWFFRFGLKDYWPYIAMGITYAGATIAELAKRQRLHVLADPLFNTAIVLPLVLSAGYWAIQSKADPALLMLMGGVYYMLIGAVRRNPIFGVLSFLFANVALWFWFDRFPDLSFQKSPQLWLIPPALSAIIAAQMNRARLTDAQIALIRYVSVAVIYISSTSEIFLHGLGEHLLPPMILTALSVVGIFAGMLLRIRAYLYFGVLFLLVSMISMVSHAHHRLDHVWPWWAFGIGLGTAILVMFGLFEKKKNQLGSLARQLQNWDY